MGRLTIALLLLGGLAVRVGADEPPAPPAAPVAPAAPALPPAPVVPGPASPAPGPASPTAKPDRPKAPPIVGMAWERDFDAGVRRSIVEGRPIYVCVNALLDEGEGGNRALFETYYRAPEAGFATKEWVCLVANGNRHEDTVLPDGSKICSRYASGTCACHQAALAYALKRWSADGSTLVSPSHYVVDPDGRSVYQADYMQGRLAFPALDAYLAQLSPRLASRTVWTSRESKMKELGTIPVDRLAAWGREWIAAGDAYAPVGLAAAMDGATDAATVLALLDALRTTPLALASVLQDALEAATAEPGADPELALAWIATALVVDKDLGAWGAARAIARAMKPELVGKITAVWVGTLEKPDASAMPQTAIARLGEAMALRGDKGAVSLILNTGAALPPARVAHAAAKAGVPLVAATGLAPRDARREALLASGAEPTKEERVALVAALSVALRDPIEEIRVAAALALRRIGDSAGADLLLRALSDPVEGPEVHAALTAMAGDDRGGDAAAWESFVRATDGGAK